MDCTTNSDDILYLSRFALFSDWFYCLFFNDFFC